MDTKELWLKFLDNLKELVEIVPFETWFKNEDTSLYSFDNNEAILVVKQDFIKKHIENNFDDVINEAWYKTVGREVSYKIMLESEIKKERKSNIFVDDSNEFVKQNPLNAGINPNQTFESFIVGDSNKFAYRAALAVAEAPGEYNPFFLYGESGVGKTHLMHAIGNYILRKTDKKVLYVASDNFVDDYQKLFRNRDSGNFDKIDSFKNKYRNVDVLIIDDIQFLSTAPKGQEEFFHTFNELQSQNKQIIIASDRCVDDLNSIENRLLTRFSGGLTANIMTPDYDLRVGIIKSKLKYKEAANDIPDDVIEYIANNFESNIRELEGAITRVFAYSSMVCQGRIDLDIAIEALKDRIKVTGGTSAGYKSDVQRIQRVVCEYYKISIEQMKGKKKSNEINFPRQVAIYLCRELTNESFPKIGYYFGGRNHSTIISAYQKIKKELNSNDNLRLVIKDLRKNLT